jgi:hypothetical protein
MQCYSNEIIYFLRPGPNCEKENIRAKFGVNRSSDSFNKLSYEKEKKATQQKSIVLYYRILQKR